MSVSTETVKTAVKQDDGSWTTIDVDVLKSQILDKVDSLIDVDSDFLDSLAVKLVTMLAQTKLDQYAYDNGLIDLCDTFTFEDYHQAQVDAEAREIAATWIADGEVKDENGSVVTDVDYFFRNDNGQFDHEIERAYENADMFGDVFSECSRRWQASATECWRDVSEPWLVAVHGDAYGDVDASVMKSWQEFGSEFADAAVMDFS